MCWAITGSNFDIDLEFEDDLNRGQKVQIAEKVVASLVTMKCPHQIFPHQISGNDFESILPVMKWLMKKLKESRDLRGAVNRKQGLFNYKVIAER